MSSHRNLIQSPRLGDQRFYRPRIILFVPALGRWDNLGWFGLLGSAGLAGIVGKKSEK